MMVELIKGFLVGFIISVLAGLTLCVLWFIGAMIVNFWKIYCKKKPSKNDCKHSSCCHNPDEDLWICNDCGKGFI